MYSILTNQDAHDAITAEFTRFKNERTARQKRMAFAQQLTDAYVDYHGNRPPTSVLDRLATLILQDELADKNEHKMTQNECPILSDAQYERRVKGTHVRSSSNMGEVSINAAQDVATDGVDYRSRTRTSNRHFNEVFNV